ncbi:hypothetical protein PQX77_010716, partial [Marasmius sp. AFHP31]
MSFRDVKEPFVIRMFHPTLSSRLDSWPFKFNDKDSFFGDATKHADLNYLISNFLPGLNLSQVRRITDQGQWDLTTSRLLAQALYQAADADFEESPEAEACRLGFDMPCGNGIRFSERFESAFDPLAILHSLDARVVQSPQVVLDLIRYPQADDEEDQPFRRAFHRALKRYLYGRGHPPCAVQRNLVNPESAAEVSDDSTFRARSFLKQVTGSMLVPQPTGEEHLVN